MGTIKLFKKFIEESIWSDMQDRSSGDTVRKEDEYDIDEKELERNVDQCIKTYVISSVYYDKYDGSSDTFLKCIQEWDRCICGNPHLYDRRFGKYVEPIKVIPSYIKENWETGKSYKSLVDKKISEEEKKVKDAGFIKKPGESISDTLSKWFDENFEKLGDDFCEEIEEYNDEYHSEGGSRSVDLGVEDWWDNLEYIEQVEIYQDYMKKTNESIWSDMQDRSAGVTKRKEDDVNCLNYDGLYDYIKSKYSGKLYYIDKDYFWPKSETICVDIIEDVSLYLKRLKDGSLEYILLSWTIGNDIDDSFLLRLKKRFFVSSSNPMREVIKEKDGTCTNQTYIDVIDFFLENIDNIVVNESIWSDMQDRSDGDTVRQEEFTEEFIDKVESNLIGFTMSVVYYIKNYELTLDGFYKYLEENENPDEVKKIIYYVKTHKDECDKLLEKDIKFENKLLDEKVNVYLLRFVDDIVYDEKYHNTFSDIKKFSSEIFKGYKRSYDFHINNKMVFKDKSELFNDYIEDKWKNSSLKQKIDDWIKDENDKISKYGFVKEPGKTISETINDWWYSLDEDKRDDLGWDEFGDDAEEEYYTDNNPKYNEYSGEDFEADEWWDAAYGIRKVKIYCHEHSKTNESIWSDMQDKYLSNINECDGVPGGLTPADVGGMGPAYFPGPNGEPGSGDLPSPTGIVYKQVAPFDTFIKIKKQKKKKKKFRKEDELCAHSENPPIYSHVDDFRDYVDRTYDDIDKKK